MIPGGKGHNFVQPITRQAPGAAQVPKPGERWRFGRAQAVERRPFAHGERLAALAAPVPAFLLTEDANIPWPTCPLPDSPGSGRIRSAGPSLTFPSDLVVERIVPMDTLSFKVRNWPHHALVGCYRMMWWSKQRRTS
jgi:hypothetical protein